MNTSPSHSLPRVFDRWRIEDRDLQAYIGKVRDWMKEIEQFGIPHFGETATRLRPLRERLVLHFERENEMISHLAASLSEPPSEFEDLRCRGARDHESLLAGLEELSARLDETDPQFESWQAAMNEVGEFVDRLEQHEATEATNIEKCLAKGEVIH